MSISIEPQGDITLVKCPLEADYKNTFTFTNLAAQTSYFNGLSGKKVLGTDYTYIRKDGMVSVPFPIDEIINYNYLFYNNKGFTTKRYYCFIDRMEYINENCTHIFFHTDVFQTWYFQLQWNTCYVEREHVNDDSTGAHTIPEGLETGEYVSSGTQKLFSWVAGSDMIAIATTYMPPETGLFGTSSSQYGGIFSPYYVGVFRTTIQATAFLYRMDKLGRGDAIQFVCTVPNEIAVAAGAVNFVVYSWSDPDAGQTKTYEMGVMASTSSYATLNNNEVVTRPSTISGYTPKNHKLLCWPYNYFYVTNNSGEEIVYHYEDFLNPSSCRFDTIGIFTPGMSIRTIPVDYKDVSDPKNQYNHVTNYNSYNYGITAGKFPICSWVTDVYTNWLTSQSVNLSNQAVKQSVGILGAVGSFIGGLLTGNPVSGITSAAKQLESPVNSIMNTQAAMYEHSLISPTLSGQTNSGDVAFSGGYIDNVVHKMQIKPDVAAVIDGFFTMFGYKVNTIKVPNITGRTYWNYVKTIGCNVEGDIPQEDLETIRSAMNSGVTFWHDTTKMYHYELTNSIVTP